MARAVAERSGLIGDSLNPFTAPEWELGCVG
jgi:hypothetical protein